MLVGLSGHFSGLLRPYANLPMVGGLGATCVFLFLGLNRYRIIAVTSTRIVVLDAGKASMAKAFGAVTELPRSTRLGLATGIWHQIPAGQETLRVHRRFFKDIQTADSVAAAA